MIAIPIRMTLEDLTAIPIGIVRFIQTLLDPDATAWDIVVAFTIPAMPGFVSAVLKALDEGGSVMDIIMNLGAQLPSPIGDIVQWLQDGGIGLAIDFITSPGEWLPRIWQWIQDAAIPLLGFFSFGFIPAILEFIWDWSKKGLKLVAEIDFTGLNPFSSRNRGSRDSRSDTQRSLEGIQAAGGSIIRQARGGIVTGPTLSLIGEAGPEAVIPLSGPNARAIGGVTVNVIMPTNGLVILDNEASARGLAAALMPLIRNELRTQRAFS